MSVRFKNKSDIFNVVVTAVAAVLSVGIMLYGVWHFGLRNTWPELVLNLFYIACIVMMWMYFLGGRITTKQFNYWCTLCVGITVLLRDVIFSPKLAVYPIQKACLVLSVVLLLLLTYFYARKDWKSYTKSNLWLIFIVDMVIAILYNIDIVMETADEYTAYMLVEIWIRPTITYGLVACYVKETKEQ
jgi:hypothetical protein